MKKIVFLALLLVGCQSTSLHQTQLNSTTYPVKLPKTPEEIVKDELADFDAKVTKLDNVGEGSVKACVIRSYGSKINVFYSNEFGKRLVFRVYDKHFVNSVSMYLDKSKATEFIDYMKISSDKAQENKELEELHLGDFKSGESWVMLISKTGRVSGFWGGDSVDRVLTPINSSKISECSKKVLPHL